MGDIIHAGVVWEAKIQDMNAKSSSTIITSNYAMKGNVREDFTDVSDSKNTFYKKGNYFIYKASTNIVYLVDPEKKTYTELSMDSILSAMGAAGDMIQITISNPKVEVQKLDGESILSYQCSHIKINSSYDMETKISFMTIKSHMESTKELWGSGPVFGKEMTGYYISKAFKTSYKDLDNLIQKQMAGYKDLGFILKSVTITTSTDQNKNSQTTTNNMTVESIAEKNLSLDLFKVPAGYKKIETEINSGQPSETNNNNNTQSTNTQNTNKENNIKPEDLLKKLF